MTGTLLVAEDHPSARELIAYALEGEGYQLVFAETGASVETVLVDGRVVVENRVVKTFDVEALLREVKAMTASLRKRNADLFDVAHGIAEIVP